MDKYDKYLTMAKQQGAKDAVIIPANTIVTAEWVLLKCQYGCGGHRLTCPPHSPTPEQTAKIISEYKDALLVHIDDDTEMNDLLLAIESEMFFDGFYKAFTMGSGPCSECDECPDVCAHPRKARPSMEACGIDVFATVRAHGLPIETLRTRDDRHNFYGVVLIE